MSSVARTPLGTRAQPGLVLSIGIKRPDRAHPEKLDHFRCKPGPYSDKFTDVYGEAPTEIRVAPPSNVFGEVIDIRYKAFGKGRVSGEGYLKALGRTNYAQLAIEGDRDAINGPETLTCWTKDGGKVEGEITGPNDPKLAQLGAKVYTVFRFLIPEVLGLGTWAEISTTSEISTHNLFRSLAQIYNATSGRWYGYDLILSLQAARAHPVVDGQRITSKFYALEVRSPKSISEFLEERAQKQLLQGPRAALPPVDHGNTERDFELTPALWAGPGETMKETLSALPVPEDEPLRTRDEPSAVERPADDLLNRIARLRGELGDQADVLLVGAFGVDDPALLDAARASAYHDGLMRIAEASEPVEGEVVDDA